MVHAHLEVGEVKATGDTVVVTDLKKSVSDAATAGGTTREAVLKAALKTVVGMGASNADDMWDELTKDTSNSVKLGDDAVDIITAINDALDSYAPITNSNREMGHLVMQRMRSHAPVQFAKLNDPNPLKWLRFAQYAASNEGAHIGSGTKDEKFDIDKDYVASICGIENRANGAWDAKEEALKKVSTHEATCTLVHDTRRKYTGDHHFMPPHFVNSHGVLNIETISGAYFMTRKEWIKLNTKEMKKQVGTYSPVYVYKPEIKVPLLKYDNKYYPDLRTTGKIDGIIKVGLDGNELAVYANDLYGRIHSDDLIVLQNTPDATDAGKGDSSYHVRGGGYETLKPVPDRFSAAQELYYFGERADGSHAPMRYDKARAKVLVANGKSYDGTAKSIYQLGARFGIEHARDSVLGCVLPMKIRVFTDTYGAYCAPMPLAGSFLRPLEVDPRNPQAVMPTELELADALSRKGRHNEVGIALQKLVPNKQGDLILFDGA